VEPVRRSSKGVPVVHERAELAGARDGAAYGLCQVHGNEAWHFELRPEAVHSGCPRMFHDPTEDPRMQG
jgi:hypothetical protein